MAGALRAPARLDLEDSELDLFASCPARWYRRALLAIPEPGLICEPPPSDHPALASVAGAPGRSNVRYRRTWGSAVVRGRVDRLWYDEAAERWELLSLSAAGQEPGPLQLLARCRAAAAVLASHDQPPPARAALIIPGAEALVIEGPAGRDAALERTLEAALGVAASSWEAVERSVLRGPLERPCGRCGYRGRGCPGR